MTTRTCVVCEAEPEHFCDEGQHEDFCSAACEKAMSLACAILADYGGESAADATAGIAFAILQRDPRLRLPEGA